MAACFFDCGVDYKQLQPSPVSQHQAVLILDKQYSCFVCKREREIKMEIEIEIEIESEGVSVDRWGTLMLLGCVEHVGLRQMST